MELFFGILGVIAVVYIIAAAVVVRRRKKRDNDVISAELMPEPPAEIVIEPTDIVSVEDFNPDDLMRIVGGHILGTIREAVASNPYADLAVKIDNDYAPTCIEVAENDNDFETLFVVDLDLAHKGQEIQVEGPDGSFAEHPIGRFREVAEELAQLTRSHRPEGVLVT